MKKILTLAIPTYNRPDGLRLLILNLKNILTSNDLNKIQILISDNSTNQLSKDMILQLNSKYGFKIIYKKNISKYKKINQFSSFDSNIFNIFKHAKTKYVLLLADDDFLRKDAIKYILNIIRKKDEDYVNIYLDALKPYTDIKKDITTNDKDYFFQLTKFRSGGISANIFNKKIWDKTMSKKMIGTGWIHQIYLINNLGKGQSYIIKKSLKNEFINENFNKYNDLFKKNLNSNEYFKAGLNMMNLIHDMSGKGYSNDTITLGLKNLQDRYFYKLASYKAGGIYKKFSHVENFMNAFRNIFIIKYFYLFILFCIPDLLFKFLKLAIIKKF